jgi:hypothetical protein
MRLSQDKIECTLVIFELALENAVGGPFGSSWEAKMWKDAVCHRHLSKR